MSDELTPGQATAPVTTAPSDKPADAWGQPISAERQAELQGYLDRWQAETDHGDRTGPFYRVQLTGADVSWLAELSGRDEYGRVPDLHLEGADLSGTHLERSGLHDAHLEGALLSSAQLEAADLIGTHLEGANLFAANLERALLRWTHLQRALLVRAHLEGARLEAARLEGADLLEAHLERTTLSGAQLKGASFREAHLEGADLSGAQLKGALLVKTHLEGANLHGVSLDSETVLHGATLDTKTRLGDMQWGGIGVVDLTQVDWSAVTRLGDEQGVGIRSSLARHEAVTRTYRQLAVQLRAQGLSEVGDRFAERALIRQRKRLFRQLLDDWRRRLWRLPGDLLRWLFSWFLALLAGYGYHPGRSVFWYLATITGFAALYMRFGVVYGHAFNPLEAAVFSLTSFHGRGFFPGGLTLDDPVTVLAAIEAVIGLLIEISFIATFTQRFFGSK